MLGEEQALGISWDYDQSTNAVPSKYTSSATGDDHYLQVMTQIFKECRRVLKMPGGRLAFTYHHWAPKAWSTLAVALKQAGFKLLEIHVVHSENPISVHIANMRSLTDDAILILAPASNKRGVEWEMPDEVGRGSSAIFSRDCARLLGWILNTNLTDGEIGKIWKRQLGRS
jgi:adenine-specific DNA methylase